MSPGLEKEVTILITELRSRNLTLGVGESCTGGLLSGAIVRLPGVSDLYQGGIASYSYQAKSDLLGVSSETLKRVGAVSEEVAREMARGVCERLKVTCSIAVTGIAGPGGGTPDKPVGTVWFAVRGPNFEVAEKHVFSGNREAIQDQSVVMALQLLRRALVGAGRV